MMHETIERDAPAFALPRDPAIIDALENGLADIAMLAQIVADLAHGTRQSVETMLPAAANWGDFEQLQVLLRQIGRVAEELKTELMAVS